MKAILLCGGKGTRMSNGEEDVPKPMIEIGGKPIVLHLMEYLSRYGVDEFILALGYKANYFKQYFINRRYYEEDIRISPGGEPELLTDRYEKNNFSVSLVDTGEDSLTGTRVRQLKEHVYDQSAFMVCYGDILADVKINELCDKFLLMQKLDRDICGIMTTHKAQSRFGIVESNGNLVSSIKEKPNGHDHINIGFFIFSPKIFEYIPDKNCGIEQEPLSGAVQSGHLYLYEHEGKYQPLDTKKELEVMREMWNSGNAYWRS